MSFDNIFCEVGRVRVKVIEINNNTEVNLFPVLGVNLQLSVRFQLDNNYNNKYKR